MSIAHKILIWLARLISLTAAIFFLVFVIGEGTADLLTQRATIRIEGIVLLLLLIFAALASLVAWRRERLGSILLGAAGLLLVVFVLIVARCNRVLIALLMGGPFVLSAALICLGHIRRKSREIMIIKQD